ncbi:MAG: nuclear transport factor 2 family protein [Spirosoma sp.]|nr:nuclear transport factor 2 family protein [Spirosoma sp.]
MKTKLVFLALLLMSAGSFAQTAFTQATLNEVLAEYKTNSKTFFENRLSADFRYTTSRGVYQNRNDIVAGDDQKILKTEIVEPVIFQSGDLAVVSGIHKTERAGQGGNPVMGQVACTYTFQRKQNKWLFVASQQTSIIPTQSADEEAIKKVVEEQTAASYARDSKAYMAAWANTPYITRVGSYPEIGVTKVVGDEFRKAVTEAYAKPGEPSKDKVTRDNWLIRINGNSAFVVFDQYNARPNGTTRHSVEERYLERINSEWKIVNVTVLVAK